MSVLCLMMTSINGAPILWVIVSSLVHICATEYCTYVIHVLTCPNKSNAEQFCLTIVAITEVISPEPGPCCRP